MVRYTAMNIPRQRLGWHMYNGSKDVCPFLWICINDNTNA